MKQIPFLGMIVAATMASSLAYAQGGPEGPGPRGEGFMQERFADLDTNGDGRITRDEVDAKIATDFSAADTDGNGTLSEEEADAFHQARHAERMARHEARRAEREARHEERRGDGEGRGSRHFEHAAGEDGVIDQDEFATRGLHRFEMADLDENGEVTETEMELVASVMGGRHGRHGDRHGRHDGRHGEHGERGQWGDDD